jgi:hypothetical protein
MKTTIEVGRVNDDYTIAGEFRHGGDGSSSDGLTSASIAEISHVKAEPTALYKCLCPFLCCRHADSYTFPGYIPVETLSFTKIERAEHVHTKPTMLNQFYATAIAGNDLTSSVLYTVGLTARYAGQLAPICLFFVGIVLYLFRSVYAEVVHTPLLLTPLPLRLALPSLSTEVRTMSSSTQQQR